MREIPLTQGKIALISDEWYSFISLWGWHYHPHGYAVRNTRVEPRSLLPMHRVIMGTLGLHEVEVDHIDGNRLNNQVSNLRIVTLAQNRRNRKRQSTNQTPYKGVGLHGWKYRARIGIEGRMIQIGTYATAIEAAQAYNEAAIIHHGEFARLNEL